jgi:hypothetical protein
MKHLLLLAIALFALSCAPAYPRKVTYQLGNRYEDARAKIAAYHLAKQQRFHLFQDQIDVGVDESRPGASAEFSMIRRAPDIGVVPVHRSQLVRGADSCRYEVVEIPNRRMIVEPSIGMDALGVLDDIDSWVSGNLQVLSREVGEDRNKKPRNAAKDFFFGYYNDPLP